jgi:hypothetical protein
MEYPDSEKVSGYPSDQVGAGHAQCSLESPPDNELEHHEGSDEKKWWLINQVHNLQKQFNEFGSVRRRRLLKYPRMLEQSDGKTQESRES